MTSFNLRTLTRWLSASTIVVAAMSSAMAQSTRSSLSPEAEANAMRLMRELGVRKRHYTAAQRKMDSALVDQMTMARGQRLTKSIARINTGIAIDADGRVVVELSASVTPRLLQELKNQGAELLSVVPQFHSVLIRTPLLGLEKVALLPDVRHVSRQALGASNVTSKGDVKHQADLARSSFGLTGTGVKVGVLSDSLDGLANSVTLGELPNNVETIAGQGGFGAGEGTAMLEIVHDLAPNAGLAFATAKPSQAQMAANILSLFNAGCRVIVDDWTYFAEPAFQDGPISQAITTITNGGGVYFSSAANGNRYSNGNKASVWEGNFSDSGTFQTDVGVFHSFGPAISNKVVTTQGYASLSWSDPLGAADNDYDLYVTNSDGSMYDYSATYQTGSQDPLEFCNATAGKFIYAVLYGDNGVQGTDLPRFLRVWTYRGQLQYGTPGQTFGHNAADKAFSVAASDANSNYPSPFSTSSVIETFSSDGPRRIFFNADGSAITPGNFLATGGLSLKKPDITAADGVATSVSGFTTFYGTSAAAPHAGAIAALLLEANPNLGLTSMRTILTSTAWDNVTAGWDRDSGYGVVNALEATRKTIGESGVISFSPSSVPSGVPTTATLTLPRTTTIALTFNLSSSLSGTSLPGNVTVPANSNSVSFTVTPPVNAGASPVSVPVTATLAGTTYGSSGSFFNSPIYLVTVSGSPGLFTGGTQVGVYVALSDVVPTGKVVSLTSSNPTVFPVPSSVTVLAGNYLRQFLVNTKGVTTETLVTVSATYNGTTVSNDFYVEPANLADCTLNPATVIGGSSSVGTVQLDGMAGPGGLTVTLKSGDPSVVTVPTSVTVLEGERSATFPVATAPVAVIKGYGITAKLGTTIVKPILKVKPPQILALSVLTPNPVIGGGMSSGTISLTGPAPAGGFVIDLASDKAQATVPATVTVPAGASSVGFVVNTSAVGAKVSAKITASKALSPTKTRTLVIIP